MSIPTDKDMKQLFFIVNLIPATLLFLALGDWPYGYYQFLRIVVCIASGISCWMLYSVGSETDSRIHIAGAIIFGAGAILFNPLTPIDLDRETWVLWDIFFGIANIIQFFVATKKESPKKV